MDNHTSGFNKYQWSKFVNRDRDEQYVVRSNDLKEFKEQVEAIKQLAGEPTLATAERSVVGADFPEDTPVGKPERDFDQYCQLHKVDMEVKQGKYGRFFSHYVGKTESFPSGFCNGKYKAVVR